MSSSDRARPDHSLPSHNTINIPDLLDVLLNPINHSTVRYAEWNNELFPVPQEMIIQNWKLPRGYTKENYADWEPENPLFIPNAPTDPHAPDPTRDQPQDEMDGIFESMAEISTGFTSKTDEADCGTIDDSSLFPTITEQLSTLTSNAPDPNGDNIPPNPDDEDTSSPVSSKLQTPEPSIHSSEPIHEVDPTQKAIFLSVTQQFMDVIKSKNARELPHSQDDILHSSLPQTCSEIQSQIQPITRLSMSPITSPSALSAITSESALSHLPTQPCRDYSHDLIDPALLPASEPELPATAVISSPPQPVTQEGPRSEVNLTEQTDLNGIKADGVVLSEPTNPRASPKPQSPGSPPLHRISSLQLTMDDDAPQSPIRAFPTSPVSLPNKQITESKSVAIIDQDLSKDDKASILEFLTHELDHDKTDDREVQMILDDDNDDGEDQVINIDKQAVQPEHPVKPPQVQYDPANTGDCNEEYHLAKTHQQGDDKYQPAHQGGNAEDLEKEGFKTPISTNGSTAKPKRKYTRKATSLPFRAPTKVKRPSASSSMISPSFPASNGGSTRSYSFQNSPQKAIEESRYMMERMTLPIEHLSAPESRTPSDLAGIKQKDKSHDGEDAEDHPASTSTDAFIGQGKGQLKQDKASLVLETKETRTTAIARASTSMSKSTRVSRTKTYAPQPPQRQAAQKANQALAQQQINTKVKPQLKRSSSTKSSVGTDLMTLNEPMSELLEGSDNIPREEERPSKRSKTTRSEFKPWRVCEDAVIVREWNGQRPIQNKTVDEAFNRYLEAGYNVRTKQAVASRFQTLIKDPTLIQAAREWSAERTSGDQAMSLIKRSQK